MVYPRFNIALLPEDKELAAACVHYAQAHFSQIADKYLLGKNSEPHITLCQFRAVDEKEAQAAFDAWSDKQAVSIQFSELASSNAPAGRLWANLVVIPTTALMQMQQSCHDHLQSLGLEALTPSETYFPHLTLARLSPPLKTPLIQPEVIPFGQAIAVHPRVGLSTEEGMFVRVL